MTFEKWLKTRHMNGIYLGDLEAAWNAGAKTEREACARLCEDMPIVYERDGHYINTVPEDYAAAIRERSNARDNPPALAGRVD